MKIIHVVCQVLRIDDVEAKTAGTRMETSTSTSYNVGSSHIPPNQLEEDDSPLDVMASSRTGPFRESVCRSPFPTVSERRLIYGVSSLDS